MIFPSAISGIWLLPGHSVTQGQGMGVVVATAAETEIGKISGFIEKTPNFSTPLLQKLEVFGKQLSLIIVSVSLFTFLWGIAQDYDPVFIFLVAVGLAVAAIPESLPAAITITLAIGVKKMADRNAIIRNLPSVETLGSTTLICTDKTGTLTKNQMTVTSVYAGGKSYRVTGTGYEPSGSFFSGEREVDPLSDETLALLLEAGALCNDSAMREDGYGIEGDPTEGALLVSALKAGTRLDLPRLDVIPFEPENQYMATLHRLNDHENIIYVKGSPERILSFSKRSEGRDSLDSEEITGVADEMTTQALRVLAVSYKKVDSEKNRITPDDMRDLVFLGLVGMIDPPRDEVIDAIKTCKRAGIRVIMITGDHEKTALAIAEKVGIETQGALTGSKLDEIEDSELEAILTDISVFARTSPEHKLKIVQHLQKRGEVVAVTGDGINDAPALRTADIGIAMGITGTEVSREAADMILADDNFASIVAAVEEGRDVYGKISKIILWTLPTNGGEGLSMMAALLLGLTLPLLPLHILWINTVTAIGLGTTLIAEPKERGLLNRPPRPASEPLLQPLIKKLVILVSVLMVTGALTLFLINLEDEGVDVARTITINTIVLFEIFYLLNSKSIDEHVFKRLLRNKFMLLGVTIVVLLQMLITYHPMMNTIFHTAPLEPAKWPVIILVASSVFFIIELAKEARKRNNLKNF
ncbi:Potassium-transporting ATPase ATP-binding subunit [Candidatus Methanoperedenaceae archaeon GB37]|nr:Potassium-transporting ATPase ATP-binding subunit [Candidatus Methanoperedenaceae archaeon GB37]